MIEKEIVKISYSGKALEDGSMDIRELAPALIALDNLFNETNNYLTRGESQVNLRIKSKIEKGSFIITIEVVKSIYQQFIQTFTSQDATALATFLALLGISGAFGIFQLIKKSKGRKPKSVIQIEKSTKVRMEFEGESSVDIEKKIYDMFLNPKVREAAYDIVKPLTKEGFDNINLIYNDKPTVNVLKDEAKYFKPAVEQDNEIISESEMVFHLISVSFIEGNKWRLSDGKNTHYVSILDENFLNRINKGEVRFGNNDYLRVKLRTKQWYEGTELKVSYEIIKVIKHSNEPQSMFPFVKPDNNE